MGLLSSIGGLIGLAVGGPLGAALGSGIGSLAGGGDIGDALKAGVLGFGIGSIPGAQGFVQGAAGSMGLNALAGGAGGQAGGIAVGVKYAFKFLIRVLQGDTHAGDGSPVAMSPVILQQALSQGAIGRSL